jgi:oxygen-independent coproporphyrinogen-3 oxidase
MQRDFRPRPAAAVRYVWQDKANGAKARNRGLLESRGEFIQFLDSDDLLRRTIIQGLMCHFLLYVPSIEQAYLIDFNSYFARELEELRAFEAAGLLTIEPPVQPEWITVAPKGRFLVRNLCMVFDRHLRDRPVEGRYSKTV